jgi:hypothetical protein
MGDLLSRNSSSRFYNGRWWRLWDLSCWGSLSICMSHSGKERWHWALIFTLQQWSTEVPPCGGQASQKEMHLPLSDIKIHRLHSDTKTLTAPPSVSIVPGSIKQPESKDQQEQVSSASPFKFHLNVIWGLAPWQVRRVKFRSQNSIYSSS